jgi:hypothetical protein
MPLQAGLSEDDNRINAAFHAKGKLFDDYLRNHVIGLFTCTGCGYPTLDRRGHFSICEVSFWEDDGEDDETVILKRGLSSQLGMSSINLQRG